MSNDILIDKQKLIRALVNHTPIAYIIMDDTNRIHYVNESFLKLRGLEWDKTVGELCYNISNGGKHCEYCSISKAMETGSKTMLQRKDILPNGMVHYIDDYAIPLYCDQKTGRTFLLEIMVNRSEEMQIIEQRNADLEKLVESLVFLVEAKDSYTAEHSKNVQKYATKIARQLQLTENEVFHISLAALLHDIGKIRVPLNILTKPKGLTDEEYKLIQCHPVKAGDILDGLIDLDDICQMVRHHHERVDGKGYPDGISGEDLELGSKILAVADTYDAMTSDRPYRKGLAREIAVAELQRVMGSQLDSDIVNAFLAIPEENLAQNEKVQAKHSLLVRELKNSSVEDVQKDLVVELEEMQQELDMDKLLAIIFEHTPCGYVLLDVNQTVKYANDYSLSLFGYTQEDFLEKQCDLFVKQKKDQVRKDCTRMQRSVPSGECIFDVYQIEISENESTYQMNVILDRTEEVTVRIKLQQDYLRLVQILQDIIHHEWEDADMASHEKLGEIKEKAEAIAEKYGL